MPHPLQPVNGAKGKLWVPRHLPPHVIGEHPQWLSQEERRPVRRDEESQSLTAPVYGRLARIAERD